MNPSRIAFHLSATRERLELAHAELRSIDTNMLPLPTHTSITAASAQIAITIDSLSAMLTQLRDPKTDTTP